MKEHITTELINPCGEEPADRMARIVGEYTRGILEREEALRPEIDRLRQAYPKVPKAMLRWVAAGEVPLDRVLAFCGEPMNGPLSGEESQA